jgi:hypothetical protein
MCNRQFLDTCNIPQLVKSFPVILAVAETTMAAVSGARATKTTTIAIAITTTITTTTTNNNNNLNI